ncbi:hypothetical protein HMPREF3229_00997 [Peptoniphilus harei]|uniref:Uncharacterized protein n=1 Tax=Peptoniphilus harei TaxID=54005 RepID=A0A133PNN5_9FIRM|nr:hypothetical protein HMPREF3229_00997 [Peptoniphilus harei]
MLCKDFPRANIVRIGRSLLLIFTLLGRILIPQNIFYKGE